jgi:2-polyprenyl-3-methyl-5-hydroxy-6-metoxy-1,4-benzoquinol methylase
MTDSEKYAQVLQANVQVHTALAHEYNGCQPHYRPENISYVEGKLRSVVKQTSAKRLLDLGCGTGFMIDIAKRHVPEIHGVDVTEAMLGRVDTTGSALIKLFAADTGSFRVEERAYDVVTAYSFLHHLYNIEPTVSTAYKALRPGGVFYADLEPNYYFWEGIAALDKNREYDAVVKREIQSVLSTDEELFTAYAIDKDLFNHAEYSKNILGGFREEELIAALTRAGFSEVHVFYYWFLGQAGLVNDERFDRRVRLQMAETFSETLARGLPLTRSMFKYLGFFATK